MREVKSTVVSCGKSRPLNLTCSLGTVRTYLPNSSRNSHRSWWTETEVCLYCWWVTHDHALTCTFWSVGTIGRQTEPPENTRSNRLGITPPPPSFTPSEIGHEPTASPESRPPYNIKEMKRIISGITSSRARADPSACISVLNPLLNTKEGRKLLLEQRGENALVLTELFDWVTTSALEFTHEG